MRIYGYFRENPNRLKNLQDRINLNKFGYSIPSNRLIIENVTVETSVIYRDKFMALVNLTLEDGDLLIVKSFDCLGKDFKEIYNSVHRIYQKNINLICLDYSKSVIEGSAKESFIHFLKLCFDFENNFIFESKIKPLSKSVKKVGRPEKLNLKQQKEVKDKFKKGYSIYSIAKEYSVTRTVINRVLKKSEIEEKLI